MTALVLIDDPAAIRSGVAEALTLARGLHEEVVALALAEPSPSALEDLSAYGVGRVLLARVPAEQLQLSTVAGQAIAAAIADLSPAVVLLTSSFANKEIAADAAWRTGSGLLVDVSGLQLVDGRVRGTKRTFAGTWEVVCAVHSSTALVTLSPNSLSAERVGQPQRPEISELPLAAVIPGGLRISERSVHPQSSGRPGLAEAAIVVAGGRGTLGDFDPVYELADALGAAVGTTRDCVDEGWMAHDTQIGQTGVTIAPRLYIGAGISGAPHHHGGMQAAQVIIAVNNDPDAPLAQIADLVVAADLHDVLPAAADAIRRHREQGESG